MDLINENNQLESVNLSEVTQTTLYGLVRLQCYPVKTDFICPEWNDLPYKLTRIKTKDGKFGYIYSTHVNHKDDPQKYIEIVVHMNENFELYAYLVSFQVIND